MDSLDYEELSRLSLQMFSAPDWYKDIDWIAVKPGAYGGWLALVAIMKDGNRRHVAEVGVSALRGIVEMGGQEGRWSEAGIILNVIEDRIDVDWIVAGLVIPDLNRGGIIYDSLHDRWGEYWDREAERGWSENAAMRKYWFERWSNDYFSPYITIPIRREIGKSWLPKLPQEITANKTPDQGRES